MQRIVPDHDKLLYLHVKNYLLLLDDVYCLLELIYCIYIKKYIFCHIHNKNLFYFILPIIERLLEVLLNIY